MSIKEEAFSLGAMASKYLNAAAKVVEKHSGQAAEQLERMRAEALAEDARRSTAQSADVNTAASTTDHDVSDLIAGLAQKAQEETPALSPAARAEIEILLKRIDDVITAHRYEHKSDAAKTQSPIDY